VNDQITGTDDVSVQMMTNVCCFCYTDTDLQQAFERVDFDGDGIINVEELEQIALSLGLKLSHTQAEAVVSRFGTKGQYSKFDVFFDL